MAGRRTWIARFLPLAALAGALGAQYALARLPRPDAYDVLYLPDPRTAKHLDLGLGEAWADWMHIQALLYTSQEFDYDQATRRGERPVDPRRVKYRWLSELYDSMTELDPYFVEAYLYGARFLALLVKADDDGDGIRDGPAGALKLLEKGVGREGGPPGPLAHRWELWNELGMVWYMDLRDHPQRIERCIAALKHATALPDCPPSVGHFLARISEGTQSDLEVLQVLVTRLDTARRTHDELMRRALEERVADHAARIFWKRLQDIADRIRKERGGPAASLEELEAACLQELARTGWGSKPYELAGGFWFDREANVVESRYLADAEEERRIRYMTTRAAEFKKRHGRFPADFNAVTADPQSEMRAIPHHPKQGFMWEYNPTTGQVRTGVRR